MTEAERYRRAAELFDELIDLPTEKRESILGSRCADDQVLAEQVRDLLAREDRILGEVARAGAETAHRTQLSSGSGGEYSGQRIGPYRLLQKIGEGGMGVVYEAEQLEPIRRRVALKLIKQGMNSREVVARFEAECQAVAMMDHPAVAKVFDAGEAPDGRWYFAMEYVPGLPITEHCDRAKLGTIERIELFIQVCAGVQHAHQKAIIHRDLKPSNVLVSLQDGEPVPKIIDFGIAKALSTKLTDLTLFTEIGAIMGTPEYMSPEQADQSNQGVDTRADVYSLGVMLYELLVGVLPFESAKLRTVGIAEIVRIIREETPPKPSTRVIRQGEELGSGRARSVDVPTLGRQLRGDLDWIVMKALEKEPARRYASPNELAADLRRHLLHEPVLAGPPSTIYRAKKFYERNRAPVWGAAAALLILVVGLIATTTLWTRATRERNRAETNRILAEDRFAQISRLGDLKRIRDYRAAAEELWPPFPENISALEDWLQNKGLPLAANLSVHQTTLERLRAQAHPYGAEQQAADRASHPRAGELSDARDYQEYVNDRLDSIRETYHEPDRQEILEHYEDRKREVEAEIPLLEAEVFKRRTWQFDDEGSLWQHEMLTQLVADLTLFADPDPYVGAVASVRRRLEFARNVELQTLLDPDSATAWGHAVERIRDSPHYDRFELKPQLGLIPLGPDPVTGLWEFWDVGTGDRPPVLEISRGEQRFAVAEATGLVLVLVPGGTFQMGAQSEDPSGANYDPLATSRERPVMEVTLAPYFLSKYEMTQAQWGRLVGSNPSRYRTGSQIGDKTVSGVHPVESVTWDDATWVLAHWGLTPPTESQRERAARGGTSSPWWTGRNARSLKGAINSADASVARANGGNPQAIYEEWLDDGSVVHDRVDAIRANPFGFHGIHGNVSEWCVDHYRSPYRTDVRAGDGYRKVPGGSPTRIVRGGNFKTLSGNARLSNRQNIRPGIADEKIGLRPARAIR